MKKGIPREGCFWLNFGLLFLVSLGLAAQETPRGEIFFAQGREFVLILRGQRQEYSGETLISGEVTLEQGDMIGTGPGSFAEIRFVPGGTVLKTAENTSLLFNGWEKDGAALSFSLLYGRIRLITGSEAPGPVIRAGAAAVTVTGDMGFDYLISSGQSGAGTRPVLQVYGFRGEAAVSLQPEDTSAPLSPIPLKARGWLSLDSFSSFHFIERKPLDTEILAYWNRYNFAGSPPGGLPDTTLPRLDAPAPPAPSADPPAVPLPVNGDRARRLLRLKNIGIIAGSSLIAAGAAMQGYGLFAADQGQAPRRVAVLGYIPLGLGFFSCIASIFINPELP